jgi:putative ABC transport system substrate-binding protein
VRRREFITVLSGAAAPALLWPHAARAQQPAMPVVGFLRVSAFADSVHLVAAFRQGRERSRPPPEPLGDGFYS